MALKDYPSARLRDAGLTRPSTWEDAYLRFETPQEEIRKFTERLRAFGAERWPRDSRIVELFCGRGNGLVALQRLGFTRVEGVDLSSTLASQYHGPGHVIIGDCRDLPFKSNSSDVLIVQGGLHHLADLPGDLTRVVGEVVRVLRRDGRFVVVEPWSTPFLEFVHVACRLGLVRRLSDRIAALAAMIDLERPRYERWLSIPDFILGVLTDSFETQVSAIGWGKLNFVGRKR